jgi:LuxR family transcriptional regulator, maltose regulon positive regulatory protein
MRVFLDAGEPVQGRLQALGPAVQANPAASAFWRQLVAEIPGAEAEAPAAEDDPQLVEGLSHRELAILQHVSKGYLNAEIAERLCLAEGSVKWYLHRIYEKLGVRKRRQAVERAQALGLLG